MLVDGTEAACGPLVLSQTIVSCESRDHFALPAIEDIFGIRMLGSIARKLSSGSFFKVMLFFKIRSLVLLLLLLLLLDLS